MSTFPWSSHGVAWPCAAAIGDLVQRGGFLEGYKAEAFDGRAAMTLWSVEQHWMSAGSRGSL